MDISSGILLYTQTKVFLVHPGGPLYTNKLDGFWSIPKGLTKGDETYFETARREFEEETGISTSSDISKYIDLGIVKVSDTRQIYCYAYKATGEEQFIKSNTFKLEWPPKTGNIQTYPEIDRGEWYTFQEAFTKITKAQTPFLIRLLDKILDHPTIKLTEEDKQITKDFVKASVANHYDWRERMLTEKVRNIYTGKIGELAYKKLRGSDVSDVCYANTIDAGYDFIDKSTNLKIDVKTIDDPTYNRVYIPVNENKLPKADVYVLMYLDRAANIVKYCGRILKEELNDKLSFEDGSYFVYKKYLTLKIELDEKKESKDQKAKQ